MRYSSHLFTIIICVSNVNGYAPIAVIGIIIGIIAVTSGVGLVNLGWAENSQAPPLTNERVCEEYGEYQNSEDDFSTNPDKERANPVNDKDAEYSGGKIGEPPCEKYTTYTTGGGSPGDPKIAGGSILALIGGVVVYRSTR